MLRIHDTRVAWGAMLLMAVGVAGAQDVPTRDQIPEKYTWDLTKIYPDVAAWEADFQQTQQALQQLAADERGAFDAADALLDVLTRREAARWRVDKLVVYAQQLADQDVRVSANIALRDRATNLQTAYARAVAWIEPAILKVSPLTLAGWCQQLAELGVYRHYFDNLQRQAAHKLSPREEELLAAAGTLAANPDATYNVLKNGEMHWPTIKGPDGADVQLSYARYSKFIQAPERELRRAAFEGAMSAYAALQNTYASTLAGALQANLYFAQARGFDSTLAAVLFPDNVPLSVYNNLQETTTAHLPALHRWAELRKTLAKVDELHVYDLYQPLVNEAAQDVPYDASVAEILAALAPLGDEYVGLAQRAFNERWIDVYETQGKRAGGYSWGSYDTPPYILINYNGTARDVSVTAHELGHSLHSYLTHHNQPPIYGEYSSFVAEVAAIFNEVLLEEYQLQHAASRDQKLALLNTQIDNLRGTLFRQVMFADFEQQMHLRVQAGEPLTADVLGEMYQATFQRYWGPTLVQGEANGVYWAHVPHFYMNHYVFRYATSYCAAVALAEDVLAGKPGARERYLTFLKSGSSKYPLELLKDAGVDLTTKTPIEAALLRFERLTAEFGKLQKAATR